MVNTLSLHLRNISSILIEVNCQLFKKRDLFVSYSRKRENPISQSSIRESKKSKVKSKKSKVKSQKSSF